MTTARPPIILPSSLSELTLLDHWVGWRWETGKTGKLTKPPRQGRAPSRYADSTDPSTWCDLKTCMLAYVENKVDGIGFALKGTNFDAIDLDHCRNAATGDLHPWAASVIDRSGSYAEVTPSNEGVRVIGLSTRGAPIHRKFSVPGGDGVSCELYRGAERYITVTGRQIGHATQLRNIDGLLEELQLELEAGKRTERAQAKGTKPKESKRANGRAKRTNRTGQNKERDLEALIRDGCGQDFGGDRSRATWYVIHALLKQGRTADDIVRILVDPANGISAHCLDQPRPEEYARKQVEKARESAGADDTDAEIERLAKLSAVQYEQERKGAASQIGVRASILDRLVQAAREKLGLVEDDGRQGRAIELPEPEPWASPVDGAALLDNIAEALARYVIMSEPARYTAALWIAHTYLLDCFGITPRLAVRSPMKRCGKTTMLDVISRLVLRPLPTGSVTAAALFRVVEGYRPTLLVDEADTFLAEADELRGVLNSGHRKGGQVVRTVGDEHEPRAFSTFAAVAIAIIGNLPDTLHDRAVTIDLKRRMPSEAVTSFRFDRVAHLDVLARQAARWAQDHAGTIAAADPEMPGIHNREADNWAPLLSIVDVAGGPWPQRARAAATAGHVAGGDEASLIELLLGDIRDTFTKRAMNKVEPSDQIPSADLVAALVAIEGRPWAELGKSRKPLTSNALARRLKPLGIIPENIRIGDKVPKGYLLGRFKEAFSRYLGSEGAFEPLHRYKADEMGTSAGFQTATAASDVADRKCEKPANDGACSGVADEKGGLREKAQAGDGNGLTPGLSQRGITELARWYIERADAQHQDSGGVDSTALDAGLRQVLAEQVLPEFVETEFQRVMAVLFRV
jgi:hypothetical protein